MKNCLLTLGFISAAFLGCVSGPLEIQGHSIGGLQLEVDPKVEVSRPWLRVGGTQLEILARDNQEWQVVRTRIVNSSPEPVRIDYKNVRIITTEGEEYTKNGAIAPQEFLGEGWRSVDFETVPDNWKGNRYFAFAVKRFSYSKVEWFEFPGLNARVNMLNKSISEAEGK